jgi:serine/threonine protein phosphatase PrpC
VIPVEHAHLHIAAATHPGMKGKSNEDRYSVTAYHTTSNDHTPSVLALLADGIGGHRAGEVAAQLAVENINKFVANSPTNQPAQVLKQALTHTNQVLLNYSKEDPSLTGMGTTCVCAWVIGDQLYAASVGDSRLYLQRGADLICLTTDHTWVQEALSQGSLTSEQVKGHPNAHIIRRFLGTMNAINPDMRLRLSPDESDSQAEANQGLRLLPGDRLVLCSDGLTDLVPDAEILDILRTRQLELSPAQLIDLANQRGGHDNITVVTLEVPQPAHITRPIRVSPSPLIAPVKKAQRSAISWLMVILLLVAILSMVLLLIYLSAR